MALCLCSMDTVELTEDMELVPKVEVCSFLVLHV